MRDRFLWWGCVAYAALFTWLGAIKYSVHRNLVDFGIFQQTAASAFGCLCNPLEGSHWAFHFSPILYVMGLAVAIAPSPMTLIALQAVAGALCAPPVYAIVRRRSDPSIARLAALVVWLYPPLAGLIFGDVHENGFAPAAVAWTLFAFDSGRLGWAALFAALTLAVKEDQAFFLAFAGLCGAVAYRHDPARFRFALGVVAVSIAVALTFFVAIQPHADVNPQWQPVRFYAWTAQDWRELVVRGLAARAGFIVLVLAPLAFVPVRTRVMLLAVPPLVEVLASRMSTTFTLGTHYAGAWAGYVLIAFAAGAADLAQRGRARVVLFWALGLCVAELLLANPLHPGINLRWVQPRDRVLDAVLRALPRDASVATQEEAYTHLALDDSFARLLPENPSVETQACLVLIDRAYPESPRLQEYGAALNRLVVTGRYVGVMRAGDIEIYRRITPCR
jgi:uncharacterized membrane protein